MDSRTHCACRLWTAASFPPPTRTSTDWSDKVLITPEIVPYLLTLENQSQHRAMQNAAAALEKNLGNLSLSSSDLAFFYHSLQKRNEERCFITLCTYHTDSPHSGPQQFSPKTAVFIF